jgi:ABC-type multidrug transport system ATPase subunit
MTTNQLAPSNGHRERRSPAFFASGYDGRASGGDLVIETHGLSKRYGDRVAVDRVSLQVRRGEVYGFLGPNGAGKTTTLRMLVGLIRPSAGSATVVGRRPGHPAGLARIGSLIEAPAFYPYLSGRDNLRALARRAAVPAGRVDAVLDEVELSDRAGDKFSTYSLGMKQRLGVAAALLKDPELLILDEPTNGLDPQGIRDMRELLRALGAGDRTVLLSSHLLGEVQQVCDRVGVISEGQLISQSTVGELRGHSQLIVTAKPLDVAYACLDQLLGSDLVSIDGGVLRVDLDADDERVGEVNRALVHHGVMVTGLQRDERTLEEVFLQMTAAGHVQEG